MGTIFNRDFGDTTASYNTEDKNQLGVPAIAKGFKESMGKEAAYSIAVGSGVIVFVKLNNKTIADLGEPTEIDSGKALKKYNGIYFHAAASNAGLTVGPLTINFAGSKTLKLDLVKLDAEPAAAADTSSSEDPA